MDDFFGLLFVGLLVYGLIQIDRAFAVIAIKDSVKAECLVEEKK